MPPPFRHPPPLTGAAATRQVPPAPPLSPVAPTVLYRGPPGGHRVALTFDACEAGRPAGYDAAIVHILRREQVPATFFLGGRWMWSHPRETQRLAMLTAGPSGRLFELANHSYAHPHLPRVSTRRLATELAVTQAIQYALTGHQGRWVRAPYGEVDPRVAAVAGQLGLRLVQFDVVSGDPDPRVSAAALQRAVIRRVRPGSVVIMHVNGRGWHTAAALPGIIRVLRQRGYQFVTLSALGWTPSPP